MRCALRRSSCSTCVSAIAARAHRTAFAQVLSSIVPRGLSCISGGSTHASHDCGFFPRVFPQSRGARAPPPTSPPPSSPSPRASLPRDGPILRPRAGLPLKGLRLSPFAISFGATRRTRVPSSLRHSVGCCMSAPRLFKRPSSLQPLVVPYLHAAECTHAA